LSPFLKIGTILAVLQSVGTIPVSMDVWSKKQDNSGVAPLRGNDGLIYSDSNNKVDIITTQFKSAYTQEESSLPDLGQSSTPLIPDISISFKGVHKRRKVCCNMSDGP
jgi:hypothetical protein